MSSHRQRRQRPAALQICNGIEETRLERVEIASDDAAASACGVARTMVFSSADVSTSASAASRRRKLQSKRCGREARGEGRVAGSRQTRGEASEVLTALAKGRRPFQDAVKISEASPPDRPELGPASRSPRRLFFLISVHIFVFRHEATEHCVVACMLSHLHNARL